ncbi:sulfotransferase [Angustibacter sp. McL0619]|uniref:sulfotransferase n=1 Tax=Angustibacter sp. McL0619 TaxID=3415676 RepID=UPI003CF77A7E
MPKALYLAGALQRRFDSALLRVGSVESRLLRPRLRPVRIDRPVYVTGMARTGTTITLEMLSRHRDVASHCYRDMAMPFLPFVWNRLLDRLPLPREQLRPRLHQDRILITKESPEAVEEMIWLKFFPALHDEERSAVLDANVRNPEFERYYRDHIGKLLLARRRHRYLTKANYNATRLAYLASVFPDALFVVMVRDPLAHYASWLKQDELFERTQATDQRWTMALRALGHDEFGPGRRFINTGSAELVRQIRTAWDADDRARAFGLYWNSIYGHVLDTMQRDPVVARAVLLVPYEDLCAQPGEWIDRLLQHTGLAADGFASVRTEYVERLSLPSYYRATLEDRERRQLLATTAAVRVRLDAACDRVD